MEQLRIEAESILMEKYAFPKWQEKIIVDAMLDFNAQQSKERDALIDAKETIEHAIKTIERLLSGKPIKNLDEILADYKRISKSL